jgi:hypothetical protein
MPLPETILDQFRSVNRSTTDESEYYGPYTSLLTDLFPHSEKFQVVPQLRGPTNPDDTGFTIIFVVMKRKVPVFLVEIKPHVHLQSYGRRSNAAEQTRNRFLELDIYNSPIPKLYGVSAMGTCLCIYEYTKATNTLLPPRTIPDPMVVNDIAPRERWKYDLLEAAGEEKLSPWPIVIL